MPANLIDETVREILRRKKGTIKDAALDPGSPSWNDILDETWGEITANARLRVRGYKTLRKLLSDSVYEK